MNLLVAAIVCLLLLRFWTSELRSAEHQATARVAQLQQGASATLGEVAVSVKYAVVQAEAQLALQGLDSPGFWAVMDAARRNVPELRRMGIFDADGHRLCSPNDPACRRYDIGDRDYFALLRQRPAQPPTVVGPIRARPDNEPALLVAQAVGTPSQPFAGVIVAVVPVSNLQPLVTAARAGPKGIAALRTERLELLARAADTPDAAAPGPEQAVTETLRRRIAESPAEGTYRAVVAPDHLDRVVAYQKLPGYPVYALVGLAVDDVMGAWRITAGWAAALTLLLMAASVAIERLVRASLDHQDQAQALYDEAPCGYHTLDVQGHYRSINATELAWLGCTRAEVIGRLGPADFFTDEGRAAMARSFPVFQRTGSLHQKEFDLVGRQGQRRRVVVTATAVTDDLGNFVQSRSVMHDITSLHAAHVEIAARAGEQQAMLDTELVGMLKVRAGVITWTNRGMDRIFGYDRGDWIGMPIARLFDDDAHHQRTAERIAALEPGVGVFRVDQELRRKDGSAVWVDVSTVKIDPSGAESFTIVRDITDRKVAEAARLRAVELEAQNQSLRETGRLKDEFVSNLSHELRTPLNAVIGFSQLIENSQVLAASPKHERYIRQIGESGQHLLGLVQTMLDFAKTASRTMTFVPARLDVATALNEVAEMLEPKRLTAGVGITVSVAPGLDRVVNDPLRLRQMLLNLAGNAVKFSKPGGVVELTASALDDERWRVEVRDEGIGISPQDLARLFLPFVQLSAGATKAYGGTGLGLALVRSIARAQGGDVDVRSEPGQGSVFTLVLPRVLAGDPPAAPQVPGETTRAGSTRRTRSSS